MIKLLALLLLCSLPLHPPHIYEEDVELYGIHRTHPSCCILLIFDNEQKVIGDMAKRLKEIRKSMPPMTDQEWKKLVRMNELKQNI